jgi:hypothetical protein
MWIFFWMISIVIALPTSTTTPSLILAQATFLSIPKVVA